MRTAVVFLLTSLLTISPVRGWSEAGHRIIASIAFRQLSLQQQGDVIAMLEKHPRFVADFSDHMPPEVRDGELATRHEWLFQQAAIWPDLVRPPGPADRTAFHRRDWHFINLPHFLDDIARAEKEGRLELNLALDAPPDATLDTGALNVVQTIRWARIQCASPSTDPQTKAVLLAWLFHNVGDLHQPLHSTALFSSRLFPEGDRGGNSVLTQQAGNLHALWDQFPGRRMEFREARNKAIAHLADADLAALGVAAAGVVDERQWLMESHLLAIAAAYDPEVMIELRRLEAGGGPVERIALSEAYLKASGRLSDRRLVQAGYRLGAVLREILED